MVTTDISPFSGSMGPLARVTPFTHRDNATFLRILQELIEYVNGVQNVALNEELAKMLARYQELVDGYLLDLTTTKTQWQTLFDTFMADVTAQIALLNDDAIAGLIGNLESDTSNALDARYPTITSVTEQIAGITAANDAWQAANSEYGYLFGTFTYNSPDGEKLNLFYSSDGKATAGHGPNPVYAPVAGVRDPSILKIGSLWYMAHGYSDPTQKKFAIASSPDLLTWSQVTELDVSGATGLTRVWAPELTVDTNGDVYVFFTNVVAEGASHESWWVKATNVGLYTWSAPVKTAWTLAPTRCMDPFFIKKGTVWYMFYGDNNYICRATATALTGPWTTDKTADWAGWGINKEAPQVVKVATDLYRIYIDRYEGVGPDWTYPGYAYAESTDLATWTGLTPVRMGPDAQGIVLRHGSFIKIGDRVSATQVDGAMFAGANAQRYLEGTTGKSIPSGAETNIGPITIDAARSLVTGDFSFPADGQLKIGSTGVYAFTLHAGDDVANNFGNGTTEQWVTIYSPTQGRNLARASGQGGYELTADIGNVRCNAGEIIEFRVSQFSGGALPIDCRIHATRLS